VLGLGKGYGIFLKNDLLFVKQKFGMDKKCPELAGKMTPPIAYLFLHQDDAQRYMRWAENEIDPRVEMRMLQDLPTEVFRNVRLGKIAPIIVGKGQLDDWVFLYSKDDATVY